MNRFAKIAIAALAGTASLVATMDTASARRLNDREVIGLGLLGVVAGALIIDNNNRHYRQPEPLYQDPQYQDQQFNDYQDQDAVDYNAYPDAPPAPRHHRHAVNYYNAVEPWTDGWYRYCSDRYRSFNAQTGTFRGNDGRSHFCTAG